MRFKALILLILAVSMLSACTQDFDKEAMIAANSNINSYSMDMEMEFRMDSESLMSFLIDGKVDRNAEKAQMIMKMDLGGLMAMLGGGMDLTYDLYIIGETMYVGAMGEWMKMDLNQELPDGSMMPTDIWGEQDQLQSELELLSNSEMEILESETIEGTSYYVVRIIPDREALLELISESTSMMGTTGSDSEELFESLDSYSAKLWINQESLIIERGEHIMNFSDMDEFSGENVSMQIVTSYFIGNINDPMNIELPDEAKNAQDFYEMQKEYIVEDVQVKDVAEGVEVEVH